MYNSSRMKSKGKLIFLLSLASFLSVGVLLPFHIFMRWSNQVLSYDYFGSGLGFSFLIVLVSSLAVLEISLLSTVRIRNSSVPVLSCFMERGVHFRFIKAIIFSFLTCTFSFLMGLALGGEAPSVFMGAVSFALVFSFAEENQERLLRAIKVGSCVGFSLAFMNPLAGILFSFVPNKFEKGYLKKEYKLIIEGSICASASYILYACLKGLIYWNDYKGNFGAAFLFNDFQFDVLAIGWESLKHFWIPLLIAPLSFGLAYIYTKGLGFLRHLLWREKTWTYVLSIAGAIVLIPLCRYYFPLSLGSGAKLIEKNTSLLSEGLGAFSLLLLVRLFLTFFSFTSHFSGGNIIPSLAIGNLFGVLFAGILQLLLPLKEEETLLISFTFMLSFFASVSDKRSSVLALTLSFGPSPALVIALLPSLAFEYLMHEKVKSFVSLSSTFATSDIENNSYARTLWRHYPYCSPMFEEIWERRTASK